MNKYMHTHNSLACEVQGLHTVLPLCYEEKTQNLP